MGNGGQDAGGLAPLLSHPAQGLNHHRAGGGGAHFRGHDGATANRFGQDQTVARAGLIDAVPPRVAREGPRHREPDRQFRPDTGMPPDHRRADIVKHRRRARRDFAQDLALHPVAHTGQDDVGQNRLRGRAHGPNIAQRVDGRDPRHDIGIVPERP